MVTLYRQSLRTKEPSPTPAVRTVSQDGTLAKLQPRLIRKSHPFSCEGAAPCPRICGRGCAEGPDATPAAVSIFTCMAKQRVLSMMRTNIMYSKGEEFTTYQNLYW